MDSWIKDLWNKNKIFFFLLIPVILLAVFRNLLIDLIVKNSRKVMTDTENKDKELIKDITEANSQANQIIEDSKKLSEIKEKVDEDWHKDE